MPIIVCLLVLFPFTAKAQYGFDVASIEAYINDHKTTTKSAACSIHTGSEQ